MNQPPFSPVTPEKKKRNLAVLLGLLLFILLVYGVTIVRIKAGA